MTEERKPYRIEGRDSTIFRVQKNPDNPYVMVDRRPIDNPNLSYRAKGVLTYLLSRPDGWEVNIGDLVNHGIEGRDALRATLSELREAGHLLYQQEREAGRFSTGKILVYEVPLDEPQTDFQEADEPQPDLPYTVEPHAENPTQVLNKLSNKELKERYTRITTALAGLTGGGTNSLTADFVSAWLDAHSEEWVLKAIDLAKSKGGRSEKYVDRILLGWEKDGYPQPRAQTNTKPKTGGDKMARLREIANGN